MPALGVEEPDNATGTIALQSTRSGRRALLFVVLLTGMFYLAVIGLRIDHYGGNVSSLILAGQRGVTQNPGVVGHHVVVFRNIEGYDGFAYYEVAADPFLRHPLMHDPFRYQRIGYPLAVWAVSLGRREWRPLAMAVVNIAAVLAIAYLSGLIVITVGAGTSLWWALAAAVNPMLIIGVEYDLAEPLLTACCLLALLLYLRHRIVATTLALACAMLTREAAILFLLPLLAGELIARRFCNAALLILSVAPYLAWQAVLARVLGSSGLGTSKGNFDLPLVGIGAVLREARHQSLRSVVVHEGSVLVVVAFVVVALVVAALHLRRRYEVLSGAVLIHAVAAIFGGTAIWVAYASAARVFGGLYPLSVFSFARDRSPGYAFLSALVIVLSVLTFVRLVVVSPALPYYVTP